MPDIHQWKGGMEQRMNTVEEGVANFRAFQLENREFMGWFRSQQEQQAKTDKRRSLIHYTLLALLSGLIIALFSFLLTHFDNKKSTLSFFSAQQTQTDSTAGGTEMPNH